MTLDAFFAPRSVAVVGASDDPSAWGHWLARGALAGAARRPVHLVNARAAAAGDTVLGRPALAGLADLEDEVELVAVAVPGRHVPDVVAAGLARGAKAFVVVTADVGPGTGGVEATARAERDLAAQVRAGGARLLGPNCLGFVDTAADVSLAWGDFPPGDVGLVSQSGQVGIEVGHLLGRAGLGLSRFVSVGAAVDVTAPEVIASYVDDPRTRVVAVYLESLGDADALVAAGRALRATGRHLLLLSPGSSQAGARAAVSHTAALVSQDAVVDAVCRAGGIVRVRTPAALVHAAAVARGSRVPHGRRVAVISDSGGQGVLAADALEGRGLELPVLSAGTQEAVAAALATTRAATTNPVDLAGAGEADLSCYARVVEAVALSGEVDAVLVTGYFGRYAVDAPVLADREVPVARRLAEVAAAHDLTLVVHAMVDPAAPGPAVTELRAHRVAAFGTLDDAVAGLAAIALVPEPSAPRRTAHQDAGRDLPAGHAGARARLEARGVPFPAAVTLAPADAGSPDDLRRAADQVGYPAALKATSFVHKTEVGGVVLGLPDADAVVAAAHEMLARLGPVELTVEAMAARPADAVELLVGARRDAHAGVVVTVAAGGVMAELLDDVAVALAPLDLVAAQALVSRLSVSRLLDGWRGAPALDRAGVAAVVVAVGEAVAADPSLVDLEVNPVLVTEDGVLALDAWATRDTP